MIDPQKGRLHLRRRRLLYNCSSSRVSLEIIATILRYHNSTDIFRVHRGAVLAHIPTISYSLLVRGSSSFEHAGVYVVKVVGIVS